jgi:hypothetical protein
VGENMTIDVSSDGDPDVAPIAAAQGPPLLSSVHLERFVALPLVEFDEPRCRRYGGRHQASAAHGRA